MAAILDRKDNTIHGLAKKINKSPRTVIRWTSQPREEYLKQAEARHKKIKDLRAENKTYQEIAHELGVSIGTVHYALKKKRITTGTLQVTH